MRVGHLLIRLRVSLLALAATPLVVVTATCTASLRDEGTKVATSGVAAAQHMEQYYDTLTSETEVSWELREFRRAFTGLPTPDDDKKLQKAISEQLEAIAYRRDFASALEDAYIGLSHLTAYDAASDVVASADKVQSAAENLLKSPPLTATISDALSGNIKTVLDAFIKEILTIKQNKTIKKAAASLAGPTDHVAQFWELESELYRDIVRDASSRRKQVLGELLDLKQDGKCCALFVDAKHLLDPVMSAWGLTWVEKPETLNDPKVRADIKAMIEARSDSLTNTTIATTERISKELKAVAAKARAIGSDHTPADRKAQSTSRTH